MTLDKAIKHCKEKAEELRKQVDTHIVVDAEEIGDCIECANEHEQLAEWLEDYKRLLGEKSYAMGFQDGLEDGLNDIRPKGEWIWRETGTSICRYGYFTCSNCSFVSKAKQNFCAECGADMREGGAE